MPYLVGILAPCLGMTTPGPLLSALGASTLGFSLLSHGCACFGFVPFAADSVFLGLFPSLKSTSQVDLLILVADIVASGSLLPPRSAVCVGPVPSVWASAMLGSLTAGA